MKQTLTDANFPRTAEGRVYHLGLKAGEVANRIVTVGDPARARTIAAAFDEPPFELQSERGFVTLTGRYKGVPMSVVAIGMGFSAMDFFVREVRACVSGDMIIIRLGSCGALDPSIPVASVIAPKASCAITSNYDYFTQDDGVQREPYLISKPVASDDKLHGELLSKLQGQTPPSVNGVVLGDTVNASADSFYSSQGRTDPSFLDANETLLQTLIKRVPGIATLEMETHQLFFLAALASRDKPPTTSTSSSQAPASFDTTVSPRGTIRAAAVHMVFAARASRGFITPEEVRSLQEWTGRAVLDTLAATEIGREVSRVTAKGAEVLDAGRGR